MFSLSLQSYFFIKEALPFVPAIVTVFTFMGFFRALISKLAGDPTAANYGFLSLNPAAHLDMVITSMFALSALAIGIIYPSDTLLLIVLILFLFLSGGHWIKITPINFSSFSLNKTKAIFAACAGMIGCFVCGILFSYISALAQLFMQEGALRETVLDVSRKTISLSSFLIAINLIPLPPLEGFKILEAIDYEKAQTWQFTILPYAPLIIILLIFIPPFSGIINLIIFSVLSLLKTLVFI